MCSLCVISEIFYLVTSVWRKQYYFMYAYLGISLFIMAYVSSALSVVETYVALSSGQYNWHWRPVKTGFLVSMQLFGFCWYFNYFTDKPADMSLSAEVGYAVWTGTICLVVGLMASTMAFTASYVFVKTIYAKAEETKSK